MILGRRFSIAIILTNLDMCEIGLPSEIKVVYINSNDRGDLITAAIVRECSKLTFWLLL